MGTFVDQVKPVRAIQLFQGLNQLASIVIGVLLAKFLPLDEIGEYEIVLMLSLLVGSFIFQGLVQSFLVGVDISQSAVAKVRLYNFLLLLIGLLWTALLIIWLLRNQMDRVFLSLSDATWLDHYLIYTAFILPVQVIAYWFLLHKRSAKIIYFGFMLFATKVLVFLVPLACGYTLGDCIQLLMWTAILLFLGSLFFFRKNVKPAYDSAVCKGMLMMAVGLIGYAVVGIIPQYTDAYIVNMIYQESDTFAIFRFGSKEIPFLGALTAGISAAALPLLTQDKSKGLEFLKTETANLVNWLFPICGVLIIASPFIFPIVYSPEFKESGYLFSLLLVSIIPRIIFSQTVWMHLKKTKLLLTVSIIEVVLNVVLSLVLVNYIGLIGILLATVVAYFFEKVLLSYLLHRRGIILSEYIPIKKVSLFFVVCSILWLVTYFIGTLI